MNLAKQTELRLFTEFKNNQEAIHRNAELIEAHELYAKEIGSVAVCSVCFGEVMVWVNVDSVEGCRLPMPVRMVGNRPMFEIDWNDFQIGVIEK